MNKKLIVVIAGIAGLLVIVSAGALAAKSFEGEQAKVTNIEPQIVTVAAEAPDIEAAEELTNPEEKLFQYQLELPIDWEPQRETVDGFTARNYDVGTAMTYSSYFALEDQTAIKAQLLKDIGRVYDDVQVIDQEPWREKNLFGQELESEHLLLRLYKAGKPMLADIYLYRQGDEGAQLIFLNYQDERERSLPEQRDLRKCLELIEVE